MFSTTGSISASAVEADTGATSGVGAGAGRVTALSTAGARLAERRAFAGASGAGVRTQRTTNRRSARRRARFIREMNVARRERIGLFGREHVGVAVVDLLAKGGQARVDDRLGAGVADGNEPAGDDHPLEGLVPALPGRAARAVELEDRL